MNSHVIYRFCQRAGILLPDGREDFGRGYEILNNILQQPDAFKNIIKKYQTGVLESRVQSEEYDFTVCYHYANFNGKMRALVITVFDVVTHDTS